MYVTTNALVLRCADYRESSRMLTLLTESDGLVSASAKGVRRKSSRLAAACQPYTYCEVTLSETAGRRSVTEANALDFFPGIGADIERLALAAYFAELAETVCREEMPEPEILRLMLNSFFALSEGAKAPKLIKSAFELRLMLEAGYAPALGFCPACGDLDPAYPVLALEAGCLMCADCAAAADEPNSRLCASSLAAARYIEAAAPARLFSFNLDSAALIRLSAASEKYVLNKLERGFRSLDYYKKFGAQQ